MDILLGSNGTQILRLHDVAFCPTFATNLVSLGDLRRRGFWWDNRPGHNELRRGNRIVGRLQELYGQNVIESLPKDFNRQAFFTRRNKFNSRTIRAPN